MKGVLLQNDLRYPKRLLILLGKRAPEELNFQGNLKLLECKTIGFCGSRAASLKGLETAEDCARQAAKLGWVIISGNATGIDLRAHYSALSSGGNTILVLPEGLDHFRIKKELRTVWDWSRVLVVSQFPNNASWQVYRAMTRNQLIVALSQAMIVIEAGEKGGTMNAAISALNLKIPLYVAVYNEMHTHASGNEQLIKLGARVLYKSRKTGHAKIPNILDEISTLHLSNSITQSHLNFL